MEDIVFPCKNATAPAFRVGTWVEEPLASAKSRSKHSGGRTGVILGIESSARKGAVCHADVLLVSVVHLSLKPPQLRTFERISLPLRKLRAFRGTPTCGPHELENKFLQAMSEIATITCPDECNDEEILVAGGLQENSQEQPLPPEDACMSMPLSSLLIGSFTPPEKETPAMVEQEALDTHQKEQPSTLAACRESTPESRTAPRKASLNQCIASQVMPNDQVSGNVAGIQEGSQAYLASSLEETNMQRSQSSLLIGSSTPPAEGIPIPAVEDSSKKSEAQQFDTFAGYCECAQDRESLAALQNLCECHSSPVVSNDQVLDVRERHRQLLEELTSMSSMDSAARRKRLRELQLELHPDKQSDSFQRQLRHPLFLLVQAAWEENEVTQSSPLKRKREDVTSPEKLVAKTSRIWSGHTSIDETINAKVHVQFFRGTKMRVFKGNAQKPQGLKISGGTQATTLATPGACSIALYQIATFGLSNNIRFNPEDVRKCYTKCIDEGEATLVVEMNRGVEQWAFYVALSGASPKQLRSLIAMSTEAVIASS